MILPVQIQAPPILAWYHARACNEIQIPQRRSYLSEYQDRS